MNSAHSIYLFWLVLKLKTHRNGLIYSTFSRIILIIKRFKNHEKNNNKGGFINKQLRVILKRNFNFGRRGGEQL